MPLFAVKACCKFKNSEYLQKIMEQYSSFNNETTKDCINEDILHKFQIGDILNHEYLEQKKAFEIPNYLTLFRQFEGLTPLHIAILNNDHECVRILLEETNIDPKELTSQQESSIHIACKSGARLEILEKLLIALRSAFDIDELKDFLNL